MKTSFAFVLITLISWQIFGQSPVNAATVKVNGIDLYYEVQGQGEPLLLLHGWTQSSQFWSEYINTYAQHFTVYAIDLRGHGRSSPVTSDFTMEKSAKDILDLLGHLKLEKVKAIGLSYGGLTLLELAKTNREKLESMILIGASHSYNGAENSDNSFSYENLPESFVEQLKEIHHHGEGQIKALFDQNIDYQINLSDGEVKTIDSRILIVHGDRDEVLGIDPAIALHKKLPNSELWIVPNAGHVAITGTHQACFLEKSIQFFSKGALIDN